MIRKIHFYFNKLFAKELQTLRRFDYILFYLFYRFSSGVNPKKIVILSDSREVLSGNLKYIDEKIDKSQYEVIYFLKKSILLKRRLKEKKVLCQNLASAKYILVDDFIPFMYPLPLRKDTRFIQVWHAMGAFKTVGFSRLGKEGGPSPRSLSHRNYTDAIVSSDSIRRDYAEAFGIPIESVHALGIPRTDPFFDKEYKIKMRERLYRKYPQFEGKKVVLFAPTFRGNGVKTAYYDYSWISFNKLKEKLGEEYIFVVKMHPFIKTMPEEDLSSPFFLNISNEREINDFLFVADILITDYSSVIFEASLLEINTIFFVPDLEEYIATRDFYYPFEKYTFGPVVKDDEELIEAIKEEKVNKEKLKGFKNMFCSCCDGKSSERFVKYFLCGE